MNRTPRQPQSRSAGRPTLSSRESIQDAAFELFLENGYEGTTVDQIALRAGVGRSTFFNYFPSKSDVFWLELDDALDRAAEFAPLAAEPQARIREVLLVVGGFFGPTRVPFALTQYSLIGGTDELASSALGRVTRLSELLLRAGSGTAVPSAVRAWVYSAIGAGLAAAIQWAESGMTRGELVPFLEDALEPVLGRR